jgi:hypothetical protein
VIQIFHFEVQESSDPFAGFNRQLASRDERRSIERPLCGLQGDGFVLVVQEGDAKIRLFPLKNVRIRSLLYYSRVGAPRNVYWLVAYICEPNLCSTLAADLKRLAAQFHYFPCYRSSLIIRRFHCPIGHNPCRLCATGRQLRYFARCNRLSRLRQRKIHDSHLLRKRPVC